MLLLLAGASDTARGLLANSFLSAHPSWKHLALEDIYETGGENAEVDSFQTAFNTIVACECVRDAQKSEHCDVMITCPAPEMLETVQDEFTKNDLVCIRLDEKKEWDGYPFDHTINAKKCSLKEIEQLLRKLAHS